MPENRNYQDIAANVQILRDNLFDAILWHMEELARLGHDAGDISELLRLVRPGLRGGWELSWDIERLNNTLTALANNNPELQERLSNWYTPPPPDPAANTDTDTEYEGIRTDNRNVA